MSLNNPLNDMYRKSKFVSDSDIPASEENVFYSAVVIANDDPTESKRIKVRIASIDNNVSDDNLKWCISLNPSYLFGIPIPGEHVIVFIRNPWSKHVGRFYMGPIRSGDSAEFEPFNESIDTLEISQNGL